MSHDLPTPLRDLSVRSYVSVFLRRLITEFEHGNFKEVPLVLALKKSLERNLNTLVQEDNRIRKYVVSAAKQAERFNAVTSVEKHLCKAAEAQIKKKGRVRVDDMIANDLFEAFKTAVNDNDPFATIQNRIDPQVLILEPREQIRWWVDIARVIQNWRQVRSEIRQSIEAIEGGSITIKYADEVEECIAQQLSEIRDIKSEIKDAVFSGRKQRDKQQKQRAVNRRLNDVIAKLSELQDNASLKKCSSIKADLDQAQRDLIETFVARINDAFQGEPSHWPPKVLLDLDRFGISLDAIAECCHDDSDAFGVLSRQLVASDGDVQLKSRCRLTELMARSMAETGALKETAYQKEFEQAVNCMFRPFAGELQIFWDCPEEIEQPSDITEVSRVEPFESASCEQVAILFTDKNEQVHIVQKGKYSKPELMPPIGTKLNDLADQLKQCKGHDSNAVRQIREFIDELKGCDELREWWNNKRSDRNDELLWSVMTSLTGLILIGPLARDTDHVQSQAGKVYDEFTSKGFYWERLDAEAVEEYKQPKYPEWAIVSLPLEGEIGAKTLQVATHQPCGLRAPDGKFLLPPNKWLVVAPSLLKGYKLLSCLYRCTPERDRLIKLSPDWEGLKLWDEAVASHHHGEPDKHDRDRMAFELFEAAYRRKGDEKHGQIFKKIAQQLYRCLIELKVDHWPQLDGKSLDFKKVSRADIEKYVADIEWVQDNRPRGSIVRVDRFVFVGKQSKVQLSLGTGFSDRAKAWMDLFARIAVEDAAGPFDGLNSIRKKVKALPASKSVDAQVDKIEKELKEWLKSKEGEQALNAAMTQICSDPSVPISRLWIDLLKLLEQTEDFDIFPAFALHEDRCEVSWPAEVPESALIDWNFDATIPVGQLIDQRVTFSLDVARAAGTFSLGPESPASPISVAHGLMQLGETLSNVELKAAAEQLRKASIESSSTLQMPAEAAVQELLQMLTADALWKDTGVDLRDGLLAGIRSWCGFFQYQIDPKEFTYAEGTLPPGESEQLEAVFNAHSVVGQALVAKFGLLDPSGKALVSGACKVSAGPAPAGYEELLEKLRTIDELKHLMPLAGRWPAQRLKSERALANAIKGDFFEELFKSLEALGGDERAVKLQKTFAEILKSELSAFLFSPTRIGEVDPGWLKYVNRSTELSGKIKKVIKPGLRDNKGMLIAPAVVELD